MEMKKFFGMGYLQTVLHVLQEDSGFFESIPSFKGWPFNKSDVKAAFRQTGLAQRDVHIKPPREIHMKSTHLWLLKTRVCGLVSANGKWQTQSDAFISFI